jgi:hypothetical protein
MLLAGSLAALAVFTVEAQAGHLHMPFGPFGPIGPDPFGMTDDADTYQPALDAAEATAAIHREAMMEAMQDSLTEKVEDLHDAIDDALDD